LRRASRISLYFFSLLKGIPDLKRNFASDNNAGVHPEILAAISSANVGHVGGYGDDRYTQSAIEKFREHFGSATDVHFVFGGTAANVLGLQAVTRPYNAIICTEVAHINTDECGAPERFTGCKLLVVPGSEGKISVAEVQRLLHGVGDQHHVQPKVISISQSTELGTVYTPTEIKTLADFAHRHQMWLHMDGARISNAAASLSVPLRAITADVGVDVLSFGGTKNGLMYGEAIVFFDRALSQDLKYIRKQGMQLASKMRYISAQFDALLSNDLWYRNAERANHMARRLAQEVAKLPNIRITRKVEANGVFAVVPRESLPALLKEYFFYVWNEASSEVRWMTSFDTTEEDVESFVRLLRKTVG
jgi:threonine aldolase